jgi:hypothetical protein
MNTKECGGGQESLGLCDLSELHYSHLKLWLMKLDDDGISNIAGTMCQEVSASI